MKDKMKLLSDSSDNDEDSLDEISTAKVEVKCSKCDSVFASNLQLRAHSCPPAKVTEDSIKCLTCFKTFKTNKAHQVHVGSHHKGRTTASSGLLSDLADVKETSSSKKFGCQICTKRFNEMRELKTHYTLYHFWDNLTEDFTQNKDVCKIFV